jgi:hypothetical protein
MFVSAEMGGLAAATVKQALTVSKGIWMSGDQLYHMAAAVQQPI